METNQSNQLATLKDGQTRLLMNILLREDDKALAMHEYKLSLATSLQNSTSIRKLEKVVGQEGLCKVVVFVIMRGMEFFNVGKKISDSQAVTLAMDLIEVFGYENLEDIVLLFKFARQGRIGGKIFYIDSKIVMQEWIPAYLELKAIERENIFTKTKSQQNDMMSQLPDDVRESMREHLHLWEPGSNASENDKKNYARGMGSTMRQWLGQRPLTEQWGERENPVNVEKHEANLKARKIKGHGH